MKIWLVQTKYIYISKVLIFGLLDLYVRFLSKPASQNLYMQVDTEVVHKKIRIR